MGELAEKFHFEKEKNKQLLNELQRMNATLARFEARITILTKEKKSLTAECDKLKERQTLSYKLENSMKEDQNQRRFR